MESNDHESLSMTAFLFGNIDRTGQLEDDLFDQVQINQQTKNILNKTESKLQLHELNKMANLDVKQITTEEVPTTDDDNDNKDWTRESPSAVDYSDIHELANEGDDDLNKFKTILSSMNPPLSNDDLDDYDDDDEDFITDDDLLPPPLIPLNKSSGSVSGDVRPLSGIMLSKYASVDIETLFPDFRRDQTLRFTRLFKPAKKSIPQIWRGIRNKRRKKTHSNDDIHNVSKQTPEKNWQLKFAPTPTLDQCQTDDEEKYNKLLELAKNVGSKPENAENLPMVPDWRYGPAQLWYDMLEVPNSGVGFDYGFKLKDVEDEENDEFVSEIDEYSDECYQMVNQLSWEDNVVWQGEDIKDEVLANLTNKDNAAGWLPTKFNQTAEGFNQHYKKTALSVTQPLKKPIESKNDTWYSIFPIENVELVHGIWENDIIWDAQSMKRIPGPKIFTIDPNDENIILGVPEDLDPNIRPTESLSKDKNKKNPLKKSQNIFEKEIVEPEVEEIVEEIVEKNPFNISGDEFYNAKMAQDDALHLNGGGTLVQHSTPAIELRFPFFPTYIGAMKLRNFHRLPVKRYSHGELSKPGPHGVVPLLKQIKKKAKMREQERQACGGGEMFFMRTVDDLTARDGEIVLAEYCEEHPPLLMQVGMATKIKNYYKRKPGKDQGPPEYQYGENAYAHSSPFLGSFAPGQSLQTFENNLFRSPIYQHRTPETDFLVLRTRQCYFIREVESTFTVGQLCPLYEVPGPNSKRATTFVRDFLQVYIYRLFWKNADNPRRIKMDDVRKAFPAYSESSIRKRLKLCADFKRTGMDSNSWVLRPGFRLPSEDEIRAMVSPEQCCAHYSMIAAQQRLKDAGYGEKTLFSLDDDNDEEMQVKIDDEVKTAPWNTTRAFINAMKNKCILQLNGVADPTGCGEGFSYVRIPNKPTKEEVDAKPAKKLVTGTDADLRKLSLNNAKSLLKKFGASDAVVKKLTRWEVIAAVRQYSTQQAKSGEAGLNKFARGNRFSIAENQQRYKEECQRIFDLQNKVLQSEEILSTDDDSSSDEDNSDMEAMAKNLESMIASKKTTSQITHEIEEQERLELQKMMMMTTDKQTVPNNNKPVETAPTEPQKGRRLKIYRTFCTADGKEYVRIETVRKPDVIDIYTRIKTTKDPTFLRQFVALDEHQKEEMRKEKRRIQEQLRRLRRIEAREKLSLAPPPTKRVKKDKPELKLKCGACGVVGHMRTNKSCPLYEGAEQFPQQPSISVAMTEEQEEEAEKSEMMMVDEEDLVNVEGTKLVLSKQLVMRADELRRKSLVLKFPKRPIVKAKRAAPTAVHCDYLKRPRKSANRRATDPVITICSVLEGILNEMRDLPNTQPFLLPVNPKTIRDYYNIVTLPMDLQTIRENLRQLKYHSREEFLSDVHQIVENSTIYNGAVSVLTLTAQKMLDLCLQRFAEKEESLMRLEKAINPLLDDNDQVALSFLFEHVVRNKLKTIPDSHPFHRPVDKKHVRDYYTVVQRPMDLETIFKNIKSHKYRNRQSFLRDVELVHQNSVQYNGIEHSFTKKAKEIYDVAVASLVEHECYLQDLEGNIRATLDYVDVDAEIESSATGTNDDESQSRKDDMEIDIIGDDESEIHISSPWNDNNVLIGDLQITPDHSGASCNDHNHSDHNDFLSRLSEEGSDSDTETKNYDGTIIDENYDPSEFLLQTNVGFQQQQVEYDINNDLLVSDSDDET
uniref:Transcription initiation factor TFIID subunit 1 n=1 Tax=Strigamia maritima TaxID=126957 RepID=T1IVK3_STRMM